MNNNLAKLVSLSVFFFFLLSLFLIHLFFLTHSSLLSSRKKNEEEEKEVSQLQELLAPPPHFTAGAGDRLPLGHWEICVKSDLSLKRTSKCGRWEAGLLLWSLKLHSEGSLCPRGKLVLSACRTGTFSLNGRSREGRRRQERWGLNESCQLANTVFDHLLRARHGGDGGEHTVPALGLFPDK